jgi:predicted metalloprotease
MRWTPRGRSSNLEDRRGRGIGTSMGVGGTVVLLVLSVLFGRNLFTDLGVDPGSALLEQQSVPMTAADSAREEPVVEFVSFVLDDAQATWREIFQQANASYQDAKLVLFRNAVQSGCGSAQSAMGPFYCPLDQKVYIDLGFYDELENRFGAPGDFAQAYVLAHEIGHHIQNLLGTEAKVRQAQRANPRLANALSVQMELQADCYAGVWGYSTSRRNLLERGDVEEGLAAASAVGDDRIQQQSTGQISPESFTHGSSAQRSTWFRRGFDSGDPRQCDTFRDQ